MAGTLLILSYVTGLLALALADEPANEETPEEGAENSEDSEDTPLGPSEFAHTTVLFPDFPDKSKG